MINYDQVLDITIKLLIFDDFEIGLKINLVCVWAQEMNSLVLPEGLKQAIRREKHVLFCIEKASGSSEILKAGGHALPYPPRDKAGHTPFPRKGSAERGKGKNRLTLFSF